MSNWRDNLRVGVAKAEIEVFAELQKRKLTHGMVTQKTLVLLWTIPDFWWQWEKPKVVYLDGPVHLKKRSEERDERINEFLELRKIDYLRIAYEPPLSIARKLEIADQIETFLGVLQNAD